MINVKTGKEVITGARISEDAVVTEAELKKYLTNSSGRELLKGLDAVLHLIECNIKITTVANETDYNTWLSDPSSVTTTTDLVDNIKLTQSAENIAFINTAINGLYGYKTLLEGIEDKPELFNITKDL